MALVRNLQASMGLPLPTGPNPETTRWYRMPFWSGGTKAGKTITVERALQFDAVWQCIRLRAWTTGQLPIRIYERLGEDDSRPAPNYQANRPLKQLNREHTRMAGMGLASTYLNSWGDAYLGKTFNASGKVAELWPIRSDLVRVSREDGIKLFWIRDADSRVEYPEPFTDGEIIHVMGFSLDGLRGLSPVGMAREAIGAGLAMDEYQNRFYRNSSIPPLILSSDQVLSVAARKRMRRDWERVSRGFRNSWRTAILEQGVKATPLALPQKDSEFIKGSEHNIQKITRWFGLWPSMIGATDNSSMTYKTIEGDSLRFLMFSMTPEWVLFEQAFEADRDLFPRRPGDLEPPFFPKFKRSDFLQIDPLTQAKIMATANGRRAWMLPSEQRKELHLPPDLRLDDPVFNPPGSAGSGSGSIGNDVAD